MNKLIIATLSATLVCTHAYAVKNTKSTIGTHKTMQTSSANTEQTFLDENKKKPGVVTLPSGLQYKVLTEGNGAKPTSRDTVTVNYEGKLIDGSVFDSSYKRGEPISFPVQGVIPGWVEALQLMKVGSTWELYIPANLAYGDRGAPPVIGPNKTLIFKVELLGVNQG